MVETGIDAGEWVAVNRERPNGRCTSQMNWAEELVGKTWLQKRRIYKDYLSSPEWRERRQKCLDRDGHECRICGSKHELQAHHKHYKHLGAEEENDLTTLCKQCHNSVTGFLKRRKKKANRTMFDNVVSVPTLEVT